MLKKLRFVLLYTLYLLIVLALIDYFFFYRPYLRELRAIEGDLVPIGDLENAPLIEIRHVEPAVMKRLGRLAIAKTSIFSKTEMAKPAGMLRICSFGDSFTYGDEVDANHDYPSLLQKRFEAAGARNVQVVNFGVSGFGFQQSYMLWDSVGRKFDCDFHLFGPEGFQAIRDTTFGFIHHWTPYYLHARYVLDDGDVRLVEIPGETYGERFNQHFRFIPPWHVLRYDRNPPMFLRSLIPRDRVLKNPFYYDSRSMEEEAYEIQRILLAKMAESGGRFLIGHYDPDVVDNARELGSPAIAAADLYEQRSFPYLAPIAHGSPWGNRMVAEQFFRWLTGQPARPLEVLETFDLERESQPGSRPWVAGAPPFSSYLQVTVELGGVAIGKPAVNHADWLPTQAGFPTDRSVLAFQDAEKSLAEACFLAFEHPLRPGMAVTARMKSGDEIQLGTVAQLDDRVNLGIVKIEGFKYGGYSRIFFAGNPTLRLQQLHTGPFTLLVDGHEVLQGAPGNNEALSGAWLTSTSRPCWLFRGTLSGFVEPDTLPDSGALDLALDRSNDRVRIPLVGWRRGEPEDLPDPPPALRERITIDPDGTARIVSSDG